jgi:serine/threonine-protein kinase
MSAPNVPRYQLKYPEDRRIFIDAPSGASDAAPMSGKLGEGTVFAGRYRIVCCLAAGGMGAVYEVIHLETDRRRALKVMHPHLFQSDELRDRFKLEARIAAQVDSEYIVDVSDAGVDESTQMPFMVMELLRGEELGVRLKRMKRLPPDEVVTYMQQAAWALDRTHAASIVHRDLKPANLFLTTREDGTPRIKILDFGVAKLVAEGATAAGSTQSLGTPLYMAPEQFRASKKLTPAADIYALTLMTYTLLVGEAYWAEESRSTDDIIGFAMTAVLGPSEPAEQRAARSGVVLPPGFDAWFAKGTAVNAGERFATASDAVRALRAIGGPAGFGSMAIAVRPAMASDAGKPLSDTPPALAGASAQDRSATSTRPAAISAVHPGERRRTPLLAGAVALALALAGLAAWRTLRPAAAPQVGSATPPAVSMAPASVSAAAVVGTPASASPSAGAPLLEPSNQPIAAAPSAHAPLPAKSGPMPVASGKKPPPSPSLLGRD